MGGWRSANKRTVNRGRKRLKREKRGKRGRKREKPDSSGGGKKSVDGWSPFRRSGSWEIRASSTPRTHTSRQGPPTHARSFSMQLGANWYWKISKSIKTRDTKDLARQNTNYLMSSASACPFDSLRHHRRRYHPQRGATGWAVGERGDWRRGWERLQELNSIKHWSE